MVIYYYINLYSSPRYFMRYYQGLIDCFPSGSSDSYCILYFDPYHRKTTELALSALVLIICFIEIYYQLSTYGLKFQWRTISLTLIIGSLAINIAFCIWNTTYQLYTVQSYLNNLYFLVIVGYVCRMYILKNGFENIPTIHYGFIISMIVMGLFYSAIMIDSLINENDQAMVNNSCEQVWYLCINIVCLILCLIALVILYVNQREEYNRLQSYNYSESKVHNPLKSLWIWMGINTLAQIVNLVETGLLINTTEQNYCLIIPDNITGNNILKFFFAIITMMSGFLATLWYYSAHRRKSDSMATSLINNDTNASSEIRQRHGLEMFSSINDDLSL